MVILAQLQVTVLRCAPVIQEVADGFVLPPEDDITASSFEAMGDVFALYQAIVAAHQDGQLFAPEWRTLDVGDATPIVTQGGTTGWQIPLAVQLAL